MNFNNASIAIEDLILPAELRKSLQQPLGKFYSTNLHGLPPEKQIITELSNNENFILVVGDYLTKSLLDIDFIPDLIIIDYKTQRESKITFNLPSHTLFRVKNPPTQITKEAWLQIRTIINQLMTFKNQKINNKSSLKKQTTTLPNKFPLIVQQIDGEEDLLVLPLIIEAPLGSIIMYGQPPMIGTGSEGIVLISVTLDVQKKIKKILNRFNRT